MNEKSKSSSSFFWTLIDIIINKATFFFATLILARILSPVEFGLIGMVYIFFTIGSTLVESGLSVSIIRAKNLNQIELSSIFYLNIGIGIFFYLIIFFLAPLISNFYSQPILIKLIRVFSLGFLINSFRIVQNSILLKNMNFKKIAILNFPGNIVGFFFSILSALNGYGVWSIVLLYLLSQFTITLSYLIFVAWKPLFTFSYQSVKSHLNFGYKLMLSAQLNTIFENLNNALIGKSFGVIPLGYYERASTLGNYPITIISSVFNRIALPILSQNSNDISSILLIYRRTYLAALFVTLPLMILLCLIAKPLFLIILGYQWLPAVSLFQILCISFCLFPIHSLTINVLSILGRSDLFLKVEVFKKIILLIAAIISIQYGIEALLISSLIVSLLSLYLNNLFLQKVIKYPFISQIKDMLPITFITILMFFICYFLLINLSSLPNIYQIFIVVIIGLLTFFSLAYITSNSSLKYFLNIIKS